MRFGVFYELQLPKPWDDQSELRMIQEAIEQVQIADRIGIDYAWAVEHHFLEEYSHCSASEVFLSALAAKTERIRVAFGIRQVIPKYNHPSRTAEAVAMLDLISRGRVDFGIGEGATRLELHGYGVPAKRKQALSLEAAEQIANMMVMEPYPGFEGKYFSMPCRNVVPKPLQEPHPPMWIACTNRDTIKVAARNGIGALAFSFVDPQEAKAWADVYYSIIKSDECVPLGHCVNANIAMVSSFSLHRDRAEAIRRGQEGFEFFGYALSNLVTSDTVPGRTDMWGDFQRLRGDRTERLIEASSNATYNGAGIGTPDDMKTHLTEYQAAGVDQIILMQQCGRNRHEHICEALELFAAEVMEPFGAEAESRERAKSEELAPFIAAALERKQRMPALADDDIPVVRASVKRVEVNRGSAE
jgi:alkanesulfonate monooxygenase SsuD/methylene tetrahydromethanopterin reductase-like flavin-dependent oxidoreductase (luciferase family)